MRKRTRIVALAIAMCLFQSQTEGAAIAAQDRGISLPDDKLGYQIQLVYVETASAEGSNFDKNGQIVTWIEQLQAWLRIQTGKEFIFDTYQEKLDITYLKFSGDIEYNKNDDKLVSMYRKLNPTTYYGKTLVFIVDQTSPVNFTACGWAGMPSDYAFFFPNLTYPDGGKCKNSAKIERVNNGFSLEAQALLHEIIHSYGVEHVCVDSTDLVHGSPECEKVGNIKDFLAPVTFDSTGSYYFGGGKSGVDLKTQRVWSDGSGQIRPILDQGICWVGEICTFQENTFPQQGTLQLQVKSKKKWVVVNTAKSQLSSCTDCYKYSYENIHTFTKPGIYQYRIIKPADNKYGAYIGPTEIIRVIN